MTHLNVNDIIEEVLSVVEHTFSLERVRLERRLEPSIPAFVGDEEKLTQALINLLNNGFDAIGTDGIIVIATSFNQEKDEVVIAVADTGSGIPAENIDRIFDPFFTTKGVGKGTGLGLSVTLGIIEDHGGRIEVQSPLPSSLSEELDTQLHGESDKGTVFNVYLPVDREKRKDQGDSADGDNSGTG
jgi:signal transduction histidine kinase